MCEGYGNIIGIDAELMLPKYHFICFLKMLFSMARGESMSWYRDELVDKAYKFDFPD
jgi:excinuclease ABC subunit A